MAKYKENYFDGGCVAFDGVRVNCKPVSDIEANITGNETALDVTITYADGTEEVLTADIAYSNDYDSVSIDNIQITWNNEVIL